MKNTGSLQLNELLSEKRIKLDLKSNDRESVLRELVDQIPELAQRPEARQTLLRALQEREQLYSTGIGDGIALPHSRNALVGLVDNALLVFGRHAKGISYGAPDSLPARLFFLVVAPTVTQHLAILARLIRLLHDPKLRQGLETVNSPQTIMELVREAEEQL